MALPTYLYPSTPVVVDIRAFDVELVSYDDTLFDKYMNGVPVWSLASYNNARGVIRH